MSRMVNFRMTHPLRQSRAQGVCHRQTCPLAIAGERDMLGTSKAVALCHQSGLPTNRRTLPQKFRGTAKGGDPFSRDRAREVHSYRAARRRGSTARGEIRLGIPAAFGRYSKGRTALVERWGSPVTVPNSGCDDMVRTALVSADRPE